MTINWYGEGCFKIQTGDLTLLTDPFDGQTGLNPPRAKADVVLKTLSPAGDFLFGGAGGGRSKEGSKEETGLSAEASAQAGVFSINGPGEYEIKGVFVEGIFLSEESTGDFLKTVYVIEAEKIRVCVLGHLSDTPSDKVAERLEGADIIFMPAGGKPFLSKEAAGKLIRQVEPSVVIPCFYAVPGLKRTAASLKDFLKEMEETPPPPLEKLTIRKKDLVSEKTQVVVLKP